MKVFCHRMSLLSVKTRLIIMHWLSRFHPLARPFFSLEMTCWSRVENHSFKSNGLRSDPLVNGAELFVLGDRLLSSEWLHKMLKKKFEPPRGGGMPSYVHTTRFSWNGVLKVVRTKHGSGYLFVPSALACVSSYHFTRGLSKLALVFTV